MKLYLYEHCPYCIRVQWFARLKGIELEEVVLLNDDEETPISLIQQKMCPILITENGEAMPESLDIIAYLDQIGEPIWQRAPIHEALQSWLDKTSEPRRHLIYPRMCDPRFKEFATQSARDYFCHKKSRVVGDFQTCLDNTAQHLTTLAEHWPILQNCLQNEWSAAITDNDIRLFPVLYNLSLVDELVFPPEITQYIQSHCERIQWPLRALGGHS